MTAPKPLLVWLFDPIDKALPYLQAYPQEHVSEKSWELCKDDEGEPYCIPVIQAKNEKGVVEVQIEQYSGPDYERHLGIKAFKQRLRLLERKTQREKLPWKTYVMDSFSFLEALSTHQAALNDPFPSDSKQNFNINWASVASQEMTSLIFIKFPSWYDVNVIVIAHEGQKEYKEGNVLVQGIACYGQLVGKVGGAYGEMYHTEVQTTTTLVEGIPVTTSRVVLRTQRHVPWDAGSFQCQFDPCEPVWEVTRGERSSALPEHQATKENSHEIE